MSLLTLLNDELILKVCGYADTPRTLTNHPGGYSAAKALSVTCLAMSLVSTIYADRCETDEEAAWERLGLLGQGASLDEIRYAVLKARPVVRRREKLEAEERSKFVTAFSDLDRIDARLANATKAGGELESVNGARATLVKITGKGGTLRYHVRLCGGDADQVIQLKRSEIKSEYLSPTADTINCESACGAIHGFHGSVTLASLKRYRQKLEELEAGIEERCVVEVTYNDFKKGHPAFKALCEAAPTEAARLTYIAARARDVGFLPSEEVVEGKKSRLAPLVKEIADVAGDGYSLPRAGPRKLRTSGWAKAIADRAEAELAKRPVAERRGELVRRRRWAYSEPNNKAKRDALYEQIRARAPAIDPAKYPFTPMDAAAHKAADDLWRRLWSAPEGQPRRNTVASHRFQLPLCRSFDLGHLVDALRDGLSFLIPTSAIEVFPLEHYVQKMERGARQKPHLYPPIRE